MLDHSPRSSTHIENLIRFQPEYPTGIVELLENKCGLSRGVVIADVGSGAGKLSELLLKEGYPTIGIEPSSALRHAAELHLAAFSKFESVDGSAHATRLPSQSCEFIISGQAFSPPELEAIRAEWARILRPDGWVVLASTRQIGDSPFLRYYTSLSYDKSSREGSPGVREARAQFPIDLFHPYSPQVTVLAHQRILDWNGLSEHFIALSQAEELSSSARDDAQRELQRLFTLHSSNETVRIEYETSVYCGRLKPKQGENGITSG